MGSRLQLLPSVIRRSCLAFGSLTGHHHHHAPMVSALARQLSFIKVSDGNEKFGASVNFMPTRGMARLKIKRRTTHPKAEWAKKRRERNDQELTQDNQDFINKVIYDKNGPIYQPEHITGMPYISPLKQIVHERGEWAPRSIRSGVIARKIGIHPMWDRDGNRILTTLLQVVDNHVIKYIPPEVVKENYPGKYKREDVGLLLVGAESSDPQRFTKEYLGLFEPVGLPPKNIIRRFMITPNARLQPGTPLYATHFKVGQKVEIIGKTVDWGFQGVMKRHDFKGMPATHGVTKSHRRGGNTGGGGEKGRRWPGTKMPGHMGSEWRKLIGQDVLRINTKYNVIYIRGPAVMGETGSYVTIHDSFHFEFNQKYDKSTLPFPTHYPEETEESIPEEYWSSDVFNFADPSIVFEDKR